MYIIIVSVLLCNCIDGFLINSIYSLSNRKQYIEFPEAQATGVIIISNVDCNDGMIGLIPL